MQLMYLSPTDREQSATKSSQGAAAAAEAASKQQTDLGDVLECTRSLWPFEM
jgi:hypothetical protein